MQQSDELEALLRGLPPDLAQRVRALDGLEGLLEIVMDLGRLPEARFVGREEMLSHREVSAEDLAYVISHVGQFGGDNRAGIERTLHRISALRNRAGKVVGLTLRVGRAVYGTVEIIRDIVESGRSILLLGRPGVGTCIRRARPMPGCGTSPSPAISFEVSTITTRFARSSARTRATSRSIVVFPTPGRPRSRMLRPDSTMSRMISTVP